MEHLSEKDLAGNTLNVALASVMFFIEWVLNKRWKLYIKYSKTPKRLPTVLTKKEVRKILSVIKNRKHRLMIALMYAAGLRVSELVNLRVGDFEFEREIGFVRNGKGGKDRFFIIANDLKPELLLWIKENSLTCDSYMFKGNNNYHLSTQSVLMIVKKAAKKAKLEKNIHPHTFRHTFATHTIQNKYSLQSVQNLLGHKNIDTTTRYVHCVPSKLIHVKSPYDSLFEE